MTVTNTYDLKGRLKTETDAQGNSTTYLYDAMDRQIDSTIAGPEGTFGGGTRYYYDGNGNVTKIIENVAYENFESDSYFAHSKRFVYDSRNNMLCSYYNADEVSNVTLNATHYTYNGAGDLTSRIGNQDNPSAVNNNTAHTTSYEYDYMGRMIKETQPIGTVIDYSYDRAGNLLNKKVNGETALSYTYNYQNQPLTVTPASGGAVTYTYNGFGLVTGISNGGSALSYSYDSMLRPVTETYGDKALSYTYDNNGNVTSVKTTVGGTEKANVSYTYDAADRLTSVSDGQQYENYTYNNAGLLSAVTTPQTVTAYAYPLLQPKTAKQYRLLIMLICETEMYKAYRKAKTK